MNAPSVAQETPGTMSAMKLYVITRRDLSPGAQAVQSCHVLVRFAYEHPRLGQRWVEESNTLALLEVENEEKLHKFWRRARELDIRCSTFREPDLGNTMTALALEPSAMAKKLVARLPLALGSVK